MRHLMMANPNPTRPMPNPRNSQSYRKHLVCHSPSTAYAWIEKDGVAIARRAEVPTWEKAWAWGRDIIDDLSDVTLGWNNEPMTYDGDPNVSMNGEPLTD
jgi:hypothetical protein